MQLLYYCLSWKWWRVSLLLLTVDIRLCVVYFQSSTVGSGIHFRIRQLSVSTAYRRAYICPCDSPIFHTPGNVKNTIFKEKKWMGGILNTTALIIYVRGIVSKCYFCVSCLFQSQSFTGQVITVHDQRDGHFLQGWYASCKQSESGWWESRMLINVLFWDRSSWFSMENNQMWLSWTPIPCEMNSVCDIQDCISGCKQWL